ncbi:MAG: isochorismatase family protein [Planctomycetales bacterium]|nr:isochorismatase family protein [Planctomycetales bacterium]
MQRTDFVSYVLFAFMAMSFGAFANADSFDLTLRTRTTDEQDWLRIDYVDQKWNANESAVIICDMWDSHHCLNAVRRVKQLAPRIDAFVKEARRRGTTIIHAPSSCLEFYKDHPARKHVASIPRTKNPPKDIQNWCHWKNDSEENLGYPIDHTDGGEDDDLEEHERWAEQLTAMGRNPRSPWIRQVATIEIDNDDFITDDGIENWSILEHRGIKNVMLVGVHTNMCVLGRPFGLRQLANNGVNVVLVRDLTDTMYNPKMPPFVNHFSGTDLIIEHIEANVCPTVSSDQVLGGEPLRFRKDTRPHVVMLIGEQEYNTQASLPVFARDNLYKDFRVSYVLADKDDKNHFAAADSIADADLLFVSVRRRAPSNDAMALIRNHVDLGKPVVGIRTASHAFSLRGAECPSGHSEWTEFDAEVFGGNYVGHHGNKSGEDLSTMIWFDDNLSDAEELLEGVVFGEAKEIKTTSWLYKASPLKPGANVLMTGRVGDRKPHEPVTWTFINSAGGRSFYTSLGHEDDFKNDGFRKMLTNAVFWALK